MSENESLTPETMDSVIADQMEKAEVVLEWLSNRFNCPLDELRFAYENHITSKWLEDNNLYYSNGKLRNRNEQM